MERAEQRNFRCASILEECVQGNFGWNRSVDVVETHGLKGYPVIVADCAWYLAHSVGRTSSRCVIRRTEQDRMGLRGVGTIRLCWPMKVPWGVPLVCWHPVEFGLHGRMVPNCHCQRGNTQRSTNDVQRKETGEHHITIALSGLQDGTKHPDVSCCLTSPGLTIPSS